MVSPVAKAAAIMTVLSMMPTTIRTVWARRRGMLRSPIFSMTRLRQAIRATAASAGTTMASSTTMMRLVERPNSFSI